MVLNDTTTIAGEISYVLAEPILFRIVSFYISADDSLLHANFGGAGPRRSLLIATFQTGENIAMRLVLADGGIKTVGGFCINECMRLPA